MQQKYQDAIEIVRKHGKPNFSITLTRKPNFSEISENLDKNENCENRTNLVDRVFRRIHKDLMNIIIQNEIFGKVKAYCYVIEFQKRELPHGHILIRLEANNKFSDASIVDKMVSLEFPDKNTHSELFNIITKNMIHNSCDVSSYSS